jgi:3-keto-disaccharide hydrolase
MPPSTNRSFHRSFLALSLALLAAPYCVAGEWIELTGESAFKDWQQPTGAWMVAGNARPDPKDPKRIQADPGTGVIVNGKTGKTANLLSKQEFGDIEAHVEFMIPKGSNSGIKLQGLYEVQIMDSFGKTKLSGDVCGGIYPRAEMLPYYHHTSDGIAPRTNACKPFGEWQTLDVTFRAPKFDSGGQKIKNAQFEKVVLNDQIIHENVEQTAPTGHYYRMKEVAKGPLMIQADHGPVAFRKIRIRPLD